ncbi:hypothetical protein D1872_324480 [compost metagenome]
MVEGADPAKVKERKDAWWQELSIEAHVRHYEEEQNLSRKEAMKKAASDRGMTKRDVYKLLL